MEATDQIDRLIERRSRGVDPDEQEGVWKASVRKYRARHREERLRERLAWHRAQLERHTATFEALLRRHRVGLKLVEQELGITTEEGDAA